MEEHHGPSRSELVRPLISIWEELKIRFLKHFRREKPSASNPPQEPEASHVGGIVVDFNRSALSPVLKAMRQTSGMVAVAVLLWMIGYLGFSLAWVLFACAVYTLWKYRIDIKMEQQEVSRALAVDEPRTVLAHFDVLPSWVFYPDMERVEWINKTLYQLWPYLDVLIEKMVKETVLPQLSSYLPAMFKNLQMDVFTLGDSSPRVGGIKAYTYKSGREEIILDLDIMYTGDCCINLSVGSLKFGLEKLQLRGLLRVILRPLIPRSPLIGGLSFFFLRKPFIDFNLTQLLQILDVPGLSDLLRSAVVGTISSLMVLPNRWSIVLSDGVNKRDVVEFLPVGIARISVVQGADLVGMDFSLSGKKTSDPYVILKVGGKEYRTAVVPETTNPVWNETFDVIMDDVKDQVVEIEVFDHDKSSKDDPLGQKQLFLGGLKEDGYKDVWLHLENIKRGTINLEMSWLELSSVIPLAEFNTRTEGALLVVYLDSASNLVEGLSGSVPCSPRIILTVGSIKEESRWKWRTVNPVFEECFRFLVKDISLQKLNIQVIDHKMDKCLGENSIYLQDVLRSPGMTSQHQLRLNDAASNATVNMTLTVRGLVSKRTRKPSESISIHSTESSRQLPGSESLPTGSEASDALLHATTSELHPNSQLLSARDKPHPLERSSTRVAKESFRTKLLSRSSGSMLSLSTKSALSSWTSLSKAVTAFKQLGKNLSSDEPTLPRGVLHIQVVEARRLLGTDTHIGRAATSDAFVMVEFGSSIFRTLTKASSLNPVWNELFEFVIDADDGTQQCDVRIFDENKLTKSVSLGSKLLLLTDLEASGVVDKWFNLDGVSQGEVRLMMAMTTPTIQETSCLPAVMPCVSQFVLQVYVDWVRGITLKTKGKIDEVTLKAKVNVEVREAKSLILANRLATFRLQCVFLISTARGTTMELNVSDSKTGAMVGVYSLQVESLFEKENYQLKGIIPLTEAGGSGELSADITLRCLDIASKKHPIDPVPLSAKQNHSGFKALRRLDTSHLLVHTQIALTIKYKKTQHQLFLTVHHASGLIHDQMNSNLICKGSLMTESMDKVYRFETSAVPITTSPLFEQTFSHAVSWEDTVKLCLKVALISKKGIFNREHNDYGSCIVSLSRLHPDDGWSGVVRLEQPAVKK